MFGAGGPTISRNCREISNGENDICPNSPTQLGSSRRSFRGAKDSDPSHQDSRTNRHRTIHIHKLTQSYCSVYGTPSSLCIKLRESLVCNSIWIFHCPAGRSRRVYHFATKYATISIAHRLGRLLSSLFRCTYCPDTSTQDEQVLNLRQTG